MRAPALAILLLAAPLLAGCAEDGEGARLAQPTTSPIVVPSKPSPRPPTTNFNFSDPGYRVTDPWRVGDGWDYESNLSHYRRLRVLDSRLVGGITYYALEEKRGDVGQPPATTSLHWVESRSWGLLNTTDQNGALDTYTPGLALRHYKNGSFSYNHTRVEGSGRESLKESVVVQTRHFANHQTVLFPWGYVEAKRVEQTAFHRDAGGGRTQQTTMHWVHRDYLNSVQFALPDGETFKLVAVKANDFRRGTLHS